MSRYVLNDEEEAAFRRSPRVIIPSKWGDQHWEDFYAEGERFSGRQLLALAQLGINPTTVETVDVEVPGNPDRFRPAARVIAFRWIDTVYYRRRIACPIIGRAGERLKIVAPFGVVKLVYPDGSLTRSKRRVDRAA